MQTIKLADLSENAPEIPIYKDLKNELLLVGTKEKGIELIHASSKEHLISGSSELIDRVLDYAKIFSSLPVDWTLDVKGLKEQCSDGIGIASYLIYLYQSGHLPCDINIEKLNLEETQNDKP
jgi:hypothetical protein